MDAPCGTLDAIIAHQQYGEMLDGPCAAADAALRLEAERRLPYGNAALAKAKSLADEWDNTTYRDSIDVCEARRNLLLKELNAWEREQLAAQAAHASDRSGTPIRLVDRARRGRRVSAA